MRTKFHRYLVYLTEAVRRHLPNRGGPNPWITVRRTLCHKLRVLLILMPPVQAMSPMLVKKSPQRTMRFQKFAPRCLGALLPLKKSNPRHLPLTLLPSHLRLHYQPEQRAQPSTPSRNVCLGTAQTLLMMNLTTRALITMFPSTRSLICGNGGGTERKEFLMLKEWCYEAGELEVMFALRRFNWLRRH